jgi:hypothetical protein
MEVTKMDRVHQVVFKTGPYGEIFPHPLVAGVDPDDALDRLAADSKAMGSPIDMPSRGKSLDGMYALARLYVHQLRLRDAMAGELDLPEAQALRRAVMDQRLPMSLRPLGMEDLEYKGFAPILTYLGENRWQVGSEDAGATEVIEGDPAEAVERAQQIFTAWSEQDDERWMEAVDDLLDQHPRSLFHHYWAHYIDEHNVWRRSDKITLRLVGRHNYFEMKTPGGKRVFSTTRVRAVHLCDALARHNDIDPPYPNASRILEWLESEGVPAPQQSDKHQWSIGDIEIHVDPENGWIVFVTVEDGHRHGYILQRERKSRHYRLALYRGKRGRPDKSRTLAKSAWEPPFDDWMNDENDRMVLTMWFAYRAKLVSLS